MVLQGYTGETLGQACFLQTPEGNMLAGNDLICPAILREKAEATEHEMCSFCVPYTSWPKTRPHCPTQANRWGDCLEPCKGKTGKLIFSYEIVFRAPSVVLGKLRVLMLGPTLEWKPATVCTRHFSETLSVLFSCLIPRVWPLCAPDFF